MIEDVRIAATIAMHLTAHPRTSRLLRWKVRPSILRRIGAAACLYFALGAAARSSAQTALTITGQSTQRAAIPRLQSDSPRLRLIASGIQAHSLPAAHFHIARSLSSPLFLGQAVNANIAPNATWQPVGPNQVVSSSYGNVTGRVTAIALDPSDATGNTVYIGATGGGVWKSTNAAGASASVSFTPLTDTIAAFNSNSGTTAIPSLSIGAISVQPGVQNGVVLAGTGDPNDNADSYYGSGLLRSTDGGATWSLIQGSKDGVSGNHSFVGLSVAGFAWSSASSGLVVAAISNSLEGDLVGATDPTNSVRGLYYSTDAGATWKMSVVMDGSQTVQTPLPSGGNVGGNPATAVVWNPIRRSFYAAVRYHGYYQSADGITWTRLTQQPATSLSLTACPTNPGTTGSTSCPIFRGALAVQPVSGDTFALTVDSGNRDQGLWQDVCAFSGSGCSSVISFSKRLASTALEVGSGNTAIAQADYNLALAAVATGSGTSSPDTLLFVGAADLYRCSLAAGCALRNTTNATNGCVAPAEVAGAQHAVAALATSGQPLVYVGNDGGLWRSTDGIGQQGTPCAADDANHFQNLNSGLGSLAEVISLAQHPTDASTLLVGLGANGSAGTSTAGSSTAWGQLSPGEGGMVAIDPANPMNWYVSTAPGVSIRQCGSGSSCTAASFAGAPTIGLPQVANDASLINPPWILDPIQPSNLLIGTCRVWRGPAANGAAWNASNVISTLLSGAQNSACANNPVLRSLAAGGPASGANAAQNAGSTVLYAGMAGALNGGGAAAGHLYSTTAGGTASSTTSWTDLTSSVVANGGGTFNPGGFDVSSLAVDPHDASGKTIYATVNGFSVAHLYRSIDGGAHWANVSSNLPDLPANSVVVDPNDANTVYIALDSSVYVTTQVTNCTSTNCWSVYGTGLPNAPAVRLAAAAGMPTADGRTGMLRVGTYGRGIWQIPLVTAISSAQPAMTLSPVSLSFSGQAVGSASAAQTITVTNTGNAPLAISSVTITGGAGIPVQPAAQDFQETDNCTASPVAAGTSCTVQVTFLPLAAGARTGLLTVYGNTTGGQATAALSGTGLPPAAIVLTPVTLSFPATVLGVVSAAQNITLSNTGGTTATLQSFAATGDFRISANTCGATLATNAGCTVAIVFAPTVAGSRTGTFTVNDSVGTQTAALTGNGNTPATDALSPLSLTFAGQQLNTTSGAQLVTLTNTGDVALTLIAAQVTGDFTVANACGNSLSAHSACSLAVAYLPKNVGREAGVLTVSDALRSQSVALSGTGLAPPGVSLAPTSGLAFAALGVNITSASQTVTLTNNGGLPLHIGNVAPTGDFAILPGGNTCGSQVAANAACTLQIAFTPTAAGARTGFLTVTDDAASSPQTLALTGTGVDFALTIGNGTATVPSGTSAVYSLLLTSASGVPGAASFTCNGAPTHATCLVVPNTVQLGTGTATVVVTVATGVSTAAVVPDHRWIWFALLLPLGVGVLSRHRWRVDLLRMVCLSIVCGLFAAVGCGAGRIIPATGTTSSPGSVMPTPAGTSTIVVSATSAGLVRTAKLSLTVQ